MVRGVPYRKLLLGYLVLSNVRLSGVGHNVKSVCKGHMGPDRLTGDKSIWACSTGAQSSPMIKKHKKLIR